ncbi:MAG: hypothetical protein EOO20_07620 [Chryseobacterium sp.]|nr:MAG: hypothetical protein EOO20_07620 [Chryseobacterium sp.]
MANPLIDYLLNNAPGNICVDGVSELKQAKNTDDFLSIYLKYIDYCLSENFPSKTDLLQHGNDRLIAHGIYIDSKPNILNRNTAVVLGSSIGVGQYLWHSVGQVYMKDQAALNLVAKDNAFLVIDVFENAELTIKASGNAKVLINIYGNAKVFPNQTERSKIKIVNKLKATY